MKILKINHPVEMAQCLLHEGEALGSDPQPTKGHVPCLGGAEIGRSPGTPGLPGCHRG